MPNKEIVERSPVIAIFGHIDHGKSTLLDYIRKSNVTLKEAGGITQRISAYEVTHTDEKGRTRTLTFLDTPGHEAFKAMRTRGASIADIAVLVVSAEDGVKPQTLEALQAITDASLPFVIAINKIDKPQANIERTKQSLLENGIYIEGYGGTIPSIPISAKTGEGIPALLDLIILLAELEAFTGDIETNATGFVLESSIDTQKGILATLIIKNGALKKGDFVVSGDAFAPVRIMENFLGSPLERATFSSPVRIIGWNKQPKIGEVFDAYDSKKRAEEKMSEHMTAEPRGQIVSESADDNVLFIPIIIKADSEGGAEALAHEIKKLETELVKFKVVASQAGSINENDVKSLCGTPNGRVIGFSVKVDSRAKEVAARQGVAIDSFDVIYDVVEKIKEVITVLTPHIEREETLGTLKVLKIFSKDKDSQVIGGRVERGLLSTKNSVKILRRDEEIGRGTIEEIRLQKIKTREVAEGHECGLLVDAKVEISGGDVLEAYTISHS